MSCCWQVRLHLTHSLSVGPLADKTKYLSQLPASYLLMMYDERKSQVCTSPSRHISWSYYVFFVSFFFSTFSPLLPLFPRIPPLLSLQAWQKRQIIDPVVPEQQIRTIIPSEAEAAVRHINSSLTIQGSYGVAAGLFLGRSWTHCRTVQSKLQSLLRRGESWENGMSLIITQLNCKPTLQFPWSQNHC